MLTIQPYEFTYADEQSILHIGYAIRGKGQISFSDFMNSRFPNFNLVKLLTLVENQCAPLTTLPIRRTIDFDEQQNTLEVLLSNDHCGDESIAVVFHRRFGRTNIIYIDHLYFLLPQTHQGQGFAKPVFLESLQQYKNMNAKMVRVLAGLSGGGYTWAKYGFVATRKDEMERILADARIKLRHQPHIVAEMEHIFNSYYSKYPLGNEFPIVLWADLPGTKAVLRGSVGHGTLDLDVDEQIRTFITYVTAI